MIRRQTGRTAPARVIAAVLLAQLAVLLAPSAVPAQTSAPACDGRPQCADVQSFTATVSDFRESVSGRYRMVSTTVRFTNKLNRTLRLGFVYGSGLVTDDRGNRYIVVAGTGVRGIGEITGSTFDPKFELSPGESSDARLEFYWQPGSADIYGTTYEMDAAVREIDSIAPSQYRLGREHALRFTGFGEAARLAGAGPAATPAADEVTPADPEPADPCNGESRCYFAGPFAAEVVRLTKSTKQPYNDQILEMTVKFTNLTGRPLILGYQSGTSLVVDDLGNRYAWGRPGTYDTSVRGIGRVIPNREADPSFRLEPGKSRDATFTVWFRAHRQAVGTTYAFDFTTIELELLPSRQVQSVRDYAVGFQDLAPGSSKGASLGSVVGRLLGGGKP